MQGYAGVIIGIRCCLSLKFFLGSQTGNPRDTSWIGHSITGFGQRQRLKTRKNRDTNMLGSAFGYSWQMRATSNAQLIPPRNPKTWSNRELNQLKFENFSLSKMIKKQATQRSNDYHILSLTLE